MSTLSEIESAVDALPRSEQETLLRHLATKLSVSKDSDTELSKRRRWLEELRQLRERNATGPTGAPLQEVMDELRGERA